MNLVQNYSSDDSESEDSLPGLSTTVKHRYTHAPKGSGAKGSFTGFVFLECCLSRETRATLNSYVAGLSGFTSLLQDSLTASDITPHVSLTYNVVLRSMDLYDAFIKDVQAKSTAVPPPKLSRPVLLPNPEKTKLFLGLALEKNDTLVALVNAVNETIRQYEPHFGDYDQLKENKEYNTTTLHLSVAECPYTNPYPSVPPLNSNSLEVESCQICCSRGRETLVI